MGKRVAVAAPLLKQGVGLGRKRRPVLAYRGLGHH